MGEVYGVSVLKSELKKITEEFKTDPVSKYSEDLLASIKENELKSLKEMDVKQVDTTIQASPEKDEIAQKTMDEIEKLYQFKPETRHFLAVIISKKADLNQLKFNIINFNLDFYIQESYDIESKSFNEYFTIAAIKDFKNSDKGLQYWNKFRTEQDRIFQDVNAEEYEFFVITESNFKKLTEEKMIRDYLLFYKKYYQE